MDILVELQEDDDQWEGLICVWRATLSVLSFLPGNLQLVEFLLSAPTKKTDCN